MGVFDNIENAKAPQKLPFVKAGRYLLQVDGLLSYESPDAVSYVKGEFTVIKRLSEGGNEDGTRCSLSINVSAPKTKKTNMAAVYNMLEAANKGEKLTKERATALVSDKNPAKGVQVIADAFDIMVGPNKDRAFTKVTFSPAPTK